MSPFPPKLTAEDVQSIRAEITNGSATYSALARRYAVTRQAIARIAHGETGRDRTATDRLSDETAKLVWPPEGTGTGEH